jgi:hypothetical protein
MPPATAAAPSKPTNQPEAPPDAASTGGGGGGAVGAGGGVYTGSGAGVYTGSGAGVYTGSGAGVYTGSGAITGSFIIGFAAALRFITFLAFAFAFIFFFFGIYTGFDASAITITGTDTTDNAARAAISRVDFIISGRTIYLSLLSTRIGDSQHIHHNLTRFAIVSPEWCDILQYCHMIS